MPFEGVSVVGASVRIVCLLASRSVAIDYFGYTNTHKECL